MSDIKKFFSQTSVSKFSLLTHNIHFDNEVIDLYNAIFIGTSLFFIDIFST
jgi:hypothetical protein